VFDCRLLEVIAFSSVMLSTRVVIEVGSDATIGSLHGLARVIKAFGKAMVGADAGGMPQLMVTCCEGFHVALYAVGSSIASEAPPMKSEL